MTVAPAATIGRSKPSRRTPARDPRAAVFVTVAACLALALLLLLDGRDTVRILHSRWEELVFWAAVVAILNCFPIPLKDITLTLDAPVLIAVAILYPAPVAAAVGTVASLDTREFSRAIPLSRALFNRVQVGLCVYVAGVVFHATSGGLEPWLLAMVGVTAAAVADYCANVLLVSLHVVARADASFAQARTRFVVGNPMLFFVTYFGYGVVALLMAKLFLDVGAWAVATLTIPLIVARQMLFKGQELQALAARLRERERLLDRLFDKMIDERRDERARIAGALHDDVLQTLIHLSMLGKWLQRHADEGDTLAKDVDQFVISSEDSIRALRGIIRGLAKSPLASGGLVLTLRSLIQDLQLASRVSIRLSGGDAVNVAPETEVGAYQIAREALVNAVKHAKASLITVSVESDDEQLTIEVSDDGRGFDPDSVDAAEHFGLGLMRERARALGGMVVVESHLERGTRLLATFPRVPRSLHSSDDIDGLRSSSAPHRPESRPSGN